MKTKYLAFAAAAFMLASCSNDEDFVPQDDLKDAPITVTADGGGFENPCWIRCRQSACQILPNCDTDRGSISVQLHQCGNDERQW